MDIDDIIIKPYVRMTQRGKYSSPQAKEYLTSKTYLQLKYRESLVKNGYEMLPGQTPLRAVITVTVPQAQGHRADLDNIIKACLDAGNLVLYPDDRWIDRIDARRKIGAPKLILLLAALEV